MHIEKSVSIHAYIPTLQCCIYTSKGRKYFTYKSISAFAKKGPFFEKTSSPRTVDPWNVHEEVRGKELFNEASPKVEITSENHHQNPQSCVISFTS